MPKPRPDAGYPTKEHNTNKRAPITAPDIPPAAASPTTTERHRALNDRLRRDGIGGRVMITRGVAALAPERQRAVVEAVRRFDDFGPRNDPYGEHDCAVVEVDGASVIWKIDAYDLSMILASPDPLDPAVTRRVLTIMLADEY